MSASEVTDATGLQTLERFAEAKNFNKWLFDSVSPYCKGNIIEIGSGIGNISKLLLKQFDSLVVSDLRAEYCEMLKNRFSNDTRLKGIYQIDLSIVEFERNYIDLIGKFDTVIALNVVEHIKDDRLAIDNCRKLLGENGHLIILVPAYQSLYNSLDTELGHYKRYNRKDLNGLLKGAGMKIIDSKYFNLPGIVGWWFSGTILKNTIISNGQLNVFNRLIPLFRPFDRLVANIAGLSVIAIGKK